ncbi:hypothetical protein O4H66_20880 [Comamonadaceae bacterium G21597-S1]|nr:hypothetical protein [Comamonadaceae bacterium G21597-S1]
MLPAPPRAFTALMVVLWILLTCLSAGAIAEWARFPSLWGGGSVFASYAMPFWLGWGLLHVPGLIVGAFALSVRGRAGVLPLALGALAAGAIMTWDVQFQSFRQSPWALYLLVDGAWLLVFAAAWRVPAGAMPRARIGLLAFAVPVAAAIIAQASMKSYFVTWRPATSTWDQAAQLETLELYPSAHRTLPASAAEGCAILAKLAQDPYPGQGPPGGWPKRHRMLNMYAEPIGARRPGNENPAPVLRYEWWPDRAEGRCDSSRFVTR